jgi:hypothetical protein
VVFSDFSKLLVPLGIMFQGFQRVPCSTPPVRIVGFSPSPATTTDANPPMVARLAKYTPIRNKRLQLPQVPEVAGMDLNEEAGEHETSFLNLR